MNDKVWKPCFLIIILVDFVPLSRRSNIILGRGVTNLAPGLVMIGINYEDKVSLPLP